jgi:DNA polymerase-3 subunit beta
VRLYVSENQLKITANNPEQEEAEEILDVTYAGTRWKSALTSAMCWMC